MNVILSYICRVMSAALLGLLGFLPTAYAADEAPNMALLREQPYAPLVAETLSMQGKGIPWAHEINVVLPASYELKPDTDYPVLWVTDGSFYLHFLPGMINAFQTYGLLPDMIVVTVGQPTGSTVTQWGSQRTADLFPPSDKALLDPTREDDPAVLLAKKDGVDYSVIMKNAHGDKFLDFLIDEVRPALAKKYRMADDHALLGHSAGGAFTAYSVFKRPGEFQRYFIGSGTGYVALEMEKEYAKNHDDMDARIFIGAGDIESSGMFGARQRLASNPMRLGENLLMRQYPSLDIEIAVFRDKGHVTVLPLSFSEGLMFLYADMLEP